VVVGREGILGDGVAVVGALVEHVGAANQHGLLLGEQPQRAARAEDVLGAAAGLAEVHARDRHRVVGVADGGAEDLADGGVDPEPLGALDEVERLGAAAAQLARELGDGVGHAGQHGVGPPGRSTETRPVVVRRGGSG
jgi:hypothetical protein